MVDLFIGKDSFPYHLFTSLCHYTAVESSSSLPSKIHLNLSHVAQNRCDLKMLSLIGAELVFEHITNF